LDADPPAHRVKLARRNTAYTAVKRYLAAIRPQNGPQPYEVRFETPPGVQAQVDFARFVVDFTDDPGISRIVWLFSLVLGHSRFMFARYVMHQDLQTLLRCHIQAFTVLGGVPIEIHYDRMKTAVTGEDDVGHIVYNPSLLALARHYRFHPRACRPYRAKTKGKVERPFSYIRQDFFLGRSFRNLDDLNAQLTDWLDTVANVRTHGTTQRVVAEAFAVEQPELQTLPEHRFDAVLKLERRVSHDGFIAVGGNYYSVPDRTRRVVEVQQLPDLIRVLDLGNIVAEHPVLEGRRQYRIDRNHRTGGNGVRRRSGIVAGITIGRIGDHVPLRSLAVYQAIGSHLAGGRP
jgi:transposase